MMSLWPEGVIMARDVLSHVDKSEIFNLIDGENYVMFDYKVGGEIVIKNIASDFRGVYMQDINKKSINDIPMMEGINSAEDFDFVFDLSAGVPGNAEWVQYACDPKNIPLSVSFIHSSLNPTQPWDPLEYVIAISGNSASILSMIIQPRS